MVNRCFVVYGGLAFVYSGCMGLFFSMDFLSSLLLAMRNCSTRKQSE